MYEGWKNKSTWLFNIHYDYDTISDMAKESILNCLSVQDFAERLKGLAALSIQKKLPPKNSWDVSG